MKSCTAVIADDEPLLRRELRDALDTLWPELTVIGEYADGLSTLHAIERNHPTISFLDIRMPKLDGLEVAERVQGTTQLVFVTAYDQHAIDAFEQGAVDYILKPVKHSRLSATIGRLQDRLADTPDNPGARQKPPLRWIQATLRNTLRFLAVQDVYYCKSDGKYTKVVTRDCEALIRWSLTDLISSLDSEIFWQINRGLVVNVTHIDAVTRDADGAMVVRLRDGLAELPVSKSHQSLFRGM
jgi:DNA-binding LytR/AlgR family response regulator